MTEANRASEGYSSFGKSSLPDGNLISVRPDGVSVTARSLQSGK